MIPPRLQSQIDQQVKDTQAQALRSAGDPPQTDMSTPTTFEAHIPGDPMPCPADALVIARLSNGYKGDVRKGADYAWGKLDHPCYEITSWRFATPPQEKDELTQLRIKLEDAETVIEDIASDVAEFAPDGDSPNAGPRDRLAAKVFGHISAHRASASDANLSWKDKQLAGLEESLRAAKERMLKDESELTRLREENASMRTAIQYAWEAMAEVHCPNPNDTLIKRATLAKLEALRCTWEDLK